MANSQHVGAVPCPPIHLLWVIVLPLVTGGIYTGVWYWRRARELNALPGGERVGMGPVYYLIASAVVSLPCMVVAVPRPVELLLMLDTLVYVLVVVWVAIGIRRKLAAIGVETSVGFTFLFNLMHLQWAINQAHRRGALAEAA